MNPISKTVTLAAGAVANEHTTALVLTVKTCTLPIAISFNGGPNQPLAAGETINIVGGTFSMVNTQAVAVTITFWLADKAVPFSAQDNSASNAQTYLFGNLGIANGANANIADDTIGGGHVTNIVCGSTGFLTIPNAPNILVSGTNNGHRRQMIIFSISATSAVALNVLDSNKLTVLTIPIGSPPVALPTDGDVYVSGAGGNCTVTIGQIFLSA